MRLGCVHTTLPGCSDFTALCGANKGARRIWEEKGTCPALCSFVGDVEPNFVVSPIHSLLEHIYTHHAHDCHIGGLCNVYTSSTFISACCVALRSEIQYVFPFGAPCCASSRGAVGEIGNYKRYQAHPAQQTAGCGMSGIAVRWGSTFLVVISLSMAAQNSFISVDHIAVPSKHVVNAASLFAATKSRELMRVDGGAFRLVYML